MYLLPQTLLSVLVCFILFTTWDVWQFRCGGNQHIIVATVKMENVPCNTCYSARLGFFLLQMHYEVTAAPLRLAWGGVFRLCSHKQLPQQA
jgi:hypothetical protein